MIIKEKFKQIQMIKKLFNKKKIILNKQTKRLSID